MNAIRFAIKSILDSRAVKEVTRVGIEGDRMSSDESGRRAENSVTDAKGNRLGNSGMVRMWVKRRLKHLWYAVDVLGNVDSGEVASDTRRGRDGDEDLASTG